MKKIAIVLTLILCMTMVVALVACKDGGANNGELTVPKASANGEVLSWEAVPSATGYEVLLDEEMSSEKLVVLDADKTSYSYMNATVGTHTFKVRAVKGEEKTEYSEKFTFVIKEALNAPTLTKERNGNIITFKWNAVENADHYEFKIGTNLNEVGEPIIVNGTSYNVDITKEGFNSIDQYEAVVIAVPAEGSDYKSSANSNKEGYANTRQIIAPTNLKYKDNQFVWDSTDTQSHQFDIKLYKDGSADPVKEITNYNKSQSYSGLNIKEAGKYRLEIKAFSTIKRNTVFMDSDIVSIEFTVLPDVKNVTFDMTTNTLKWEMEAIDGVMPTGYTVTAVTSKDYSSSTINIESDSLNDGSILSLDIDTIKNADAFKKADKAYQVFTFKVEPKDDDEKLIFKAYDKATYLDDGNYYQYIPKEEDYQATEDMKAEWKKIKLDITTVENGVDYYDVKTFPQFMWAIANAGNTLIKITDNIDMSATEFLSPIKSFSGKIDGGNHIITGLKMSTTFSRDTISIFGDVKSGAYITNLVLSGVAISVSNDKDINTALIADTNAGHIDNVVVQGKIFVYGNMNAAAIAYENNGTINSVVINADVQAKTTAGIAVINNGSISNVTAYGSINAVGTDVTEIYAGGVVAVNNNLVTYVVSKVDVFINTGNKPNSVVNESTAIAGGIAAKNSGNITYSYTFGKVSSDCQNKGVSAYVGGFVGVNEASGTIQYSYVDDATIKRRSIKTKIGGFVAVNNGTITNALSNANIGKGTDTQNVAAFAVDNNGTINNIAYHNVKANSSVVIANGNKVENVVSYNNTEVNIGKAKDVLGDEFIIDKNISGTKIVLKNAIYIDRMDIISVDRNVNLTSSTKGNYKVYYQGGKKQEIAYDMKTNNYPGLQIIKYKQTVMVGDQEKDIEFNRLVVVK